MKGYHKRVSETNRLCGAELYKCNHPIYNKCTLFKMDDFEGYGLSVIQQRFNETEKVSWWGPIDPWLTGDISKSDAFPEYFARHAALPEDGIYPTIEVRRLMYALGMKPLKKQPWESKLDSHKIQLL